MKLRLIDMQAHRVAPLTYEAKGKKLSTSPVQIAGIRSGDDSHSTNNPPMAELFGV